MFKKIVTFVSMVVLLAAVSFNTFAGQPLIEKMFVPDDNFVAWECDGFNIMAFGDTHIVAMTFFGMDDEVVKQAFHYTLRRAVFYNSKNPDIMYKANHDGAFSEVTYEDGEPVEYRERGVFWHIIGPRGEKIQFVSGLGVYDFDSGIFSHHGLDIWQGDDLCPYFAE